MRIDPCAGCIDPAACRLQVFKAYDCRPDRRVPDKARLLTPADVQSLSKEEFGLLCAAYAMPWLSARYESVIALYVAEHPDRAWMFPSEDQWACWSDDAREHWAAFLGRYWDEHAPWMRVFSDEAIRRGWGG